MSRPPRPYPARPTPKRLVPVPQTDGSARIDYLSLEHADFLDLGVALAQEELGFETNDESGDLTRALLDLSAVVAHVLATYQDAYAAEAWLPTAQTERALVEHARRLAYSPDPGLSATGWVVVTVPDGLSGTLPAGQALATSPFGTLTAEDYETLDSRAVDAAWNAVLPALTTEAREIGATLRLSGTSLGIAARKPALLVTGTHAYSLRINEVAEEDGETILSLGSVPSLGSGESLAGAYVLHDPAESLRRFGWNADPSLYPATGLDGNAAYPSAPAVGHYYDVPASPALAESQVFLSAACPSRLDESWLLGVTDTGDEAWWVAANGTTPAQADLPLRFVRVYETTQVTWVDDGSGGWTPEVDPAALAETAITGTVSRLTLWPDSGASGTAVTRVNVGLTTLLYGAWRRRAEVVSTKASTEAVTDRAAFAGELGGLEPGMFVALSSLDGGVAQVVELLAADVYTDDEEAPDAPGSGGTLPFTVLTWEAVTALDDGATWTVGDLQLLGNLVQVAHGKLVSELLGSSDGVTPFQSFTLAKTPLGHLGGADGATPRVEVRVDGVLWEAKTDLAESTDSDRHHRVVLDAGGVVRVVFGDGIHGAIPTSGSRNISATYHVGLGENGNAAVGRLSRVKKSHPLIRRVTNPLPLDGGTEPASTADLRRQATRWIRTFDRAVSVPDHADLALLYPGVARAAARWEVDHIELVAADADGQPLSAANQALLRSFLDSRRDTQVVLVLREPEAVSVYVHLELEVDAAWEERVVEEAVRAALYGEDPAGLLQFGSRELGQPLHLSELYAALTGIEGVSWVAVRHLSLDDTSGGFVAADVVHVGVTQWITTDADRLTFDTSTVSS